MTGKPEFYRVPGFSWVRRFTVMILVVALCLVSGVVALVNVAEMDVTVVGTGVVEPRKRSHVKSKIAGTIKAVNVRSGQRLEPNQVVGSLDDTDLRAQFKKVEQDLEANRLQREELVRRKERDLSVYEAERNRARARVEAASLQLEQVSREYRLFYEYSPTFKGKRRQPVEALLPVKIREAVFRQSEAELETVNRKIDALAKSQLEQARLKAVKKKLEQDLFLLRHRIDATEIRSQVHGTVLTRDLNQLVGNEVKKGDPVLEVAELGRWQVKVRVSQIDFPKVRIGQKARVYLDAFPHTEFRVFSGKVSHLPGKTEVDKSGGKSDAYPVVVSLDTTRISDGERNYVLSYGMHATTKIVVERGNVLAVLWRQLLRSVGRLGRPEVRLASGGKR